MLVCCAATSIFIQHFQKTNGCYLSISTVILLNFKTRTHIFLVWKQVHSAQLKEELLVVPSSPRILFFFIIGICSINTTFLFLGKWRHRICHSFSTQETPVLSAISSLINLTLILTSSQLKNVPCSSLLKSNTLTVHLKLKTLNSDRQVMWDTRS